MPATEQTWRNQKFMHTVFGLTSLLMLLSTLWMMAADHNREWKRFQRGFQHLETFTTAARINAEESTQFYIQQKKLDEALADARSRLPERSLVDLFLDKASENPDSYNLKRVGSAYEKLRTDEQSGADRKALIEDHTKLVDALQDVLRIAKQTEDNSATKLKFERANLDVDRSAYNLGVRDGFPESRLHELEERVKKSQAIVDSLTLKAQSDNAHRLDLQGVLQQITADETAARKAAEDHKADLDRLEKALDASLDDGYKRFLEMPIIDCFGRPLKIDNIWLPQLTWNNNFRDVARFDRCTTCHQGIDKTAPGSAVDPGYDLTERLVLTLATPSQPPELSEEQQARLQEIPAEEVEEQRFEYQLTQAYGLQLAKQGLFDPNDVTISVVRPESPAADARLEMGDVIERINDVPIINRLRAKDFLLEIIEWGKPLTLHVRRGTPQPFSSHPRLDLYVGSLSPHKLNEMGCSACHEGQGSGTEFQWASHTPNDPAQMERWHHEYGWFNNHNWLYPMMPRRFAESTCLKCHHDVAELEPSERFPEPPAPKLLAGYNLIRQYGCFGCHEINGFDSPSKRRGPDLRAEPAYYAAAAQLLADPALGEQDWQPAAQMTDLAHEVLAHPELNEPRKRLAELIDADAALAKSGAAKPAGEGDEKPAAEADEDLLRSRLTPASHKLATLLGANDETPGQYRKVGPSLRYVSHKVDLAFLYNWIANPTDFRPSTRMPRFFGQWDHLVPQEKFDENGRPVKTDLGGGTEKPVMENPGLDAAKRFEPVEIRAIAEYLLDRSQPFEYVPLARDTTEKPSAERGKQVLQMRGCLACHRHKDFPEAKQTQGPDLSRIGAKLRKANGEKWLYSWVRQPNRYHARTVMPNLFLETIKDREGHVTDPARDVTAFLLTSQDEWKAAEVPDVVDEDLTALACSYLIGTFSRKLAGEYSRNGIPAEVAGEIKGDEALLVRSDGADLTHQKLLYVGHKTISRLGCSGCHDIPGFEDAKPIGTGLADWGRKDTSKLAFEQIVEYLQLKPPGLRHPHATGGEHGEAEQGDEELSPDEMDPATGFFVEAILHHQREGFIWQKLREPRGYDYKMTENKEYLERLRMPKFNLTQDDIEAVMTFVLGLVSEPPAARYVYKPSERRKAIVEGEQLLVKYNCVGCHTVGMETWHIEYDPAKFDPPAPFNDYAFLAPHFTPEQLAASKKLDRRGKGHAVITGMPNPDVQEDDDGKPLYYFALWQSLPINGEVWAVGGQEVPVPEAGRVQVEPYRGGDFARYLHPLAVELGKRDNPNLKESDVWGWVPPPLIREGQKVQTSWLHDFLLDPFPIRPAVVLRMPRFNMSSAEAEKLAHYFAAVDDVDYPYAYHRPGGSDYIERAEMKKYQLALNVITDNKYCVQCHLVGDFTPKGLPAAWAPNLDRVYQRLRPSYVKEWLANPKRKLTYTGMPVSFPPANDPNEAVRQKLFPGESGEALQGVVQLLMNYDAYMKHQTSIKSMVKEPPPEAAGQKAEAGAQPRGEVTAAN